MRRTIHVKNCTPPPIHREGRRSGLLIAHSARLYFDSLAASRALDRDALPLKACMSEWRRRAIANVPAFRTAIDHANSAHGVFFDLLPRLHDAYHATPLVSVSSRPPLRTRSGAQLRLPRECAGR